MSEARNVEIKQVYGCTVYLDPEGKFFAEHDGKVIKKASLRELERELAKRVAGLPVFTFERFHLRELVFVDADARNGYRDKEGGRFGRWNNYYPADAATVAKLKDLERRHNEAEAKFTKERDKIMDKLRPITVDDVTNRGKKKQ